MKAEMKEAVLGISCLRGLRYVQTANVLIIIVGQGIYVNMVNINHDDV